MKTFAYDKLLDQVTAIPASNPVFPSLSLDFCRGMYQVLTRTSRPSVREGEGLGTRLSYVLI